MQVGKTATKSNQKFTKKRKSSGARDKDNEVIINKVPKFDNKVLKLQKSSKSNSDVTGSNSKVPKFDSKVLKFQKSSKSNSDVTGSNSKVPKFDSKVIKLKSSKSNSDVTGSNSKVPKFDSKVLKFQKSSKPNSDVTVSNSKTPKSDSKVLKLQKNSKPDSDVTVSNSNRSSVRKNSSLKSKKLSSLKKTFCETKKCVTAPKTKSKVKVLKSPKGSAKNKAKDGKDKEKTAANCKKQTQKTEEKNRTMPFRKTKSNLVLTSDGSLASQTSLLEKKIDLTSEGSSKAINSNTLSVYTPTTRSTLRVSGGRNEKLHEGLPNRARRANNNSSKKDRECTSSKSSALNKKDDHKAIVKKINTSPWQVSRAHREASLNALAKVHLLYENSGRGSGLGEQREREKDEGETLYLNKRKEKTKSYNKTFPEKQNSLNKVTKKNNDRKQNGKVKRNRREAISGVVFDTKSCKRMANLNAQAILSASYCQERWRREKLEKKMCPGIQYEISHVQEERLEAFSVRASVTESTKEHEMRVTTCNTQLVVTPQQKDDSVRNEKASSKTRDKKYKTKPVKSWTTPKSHLKAGRQKKNSLEVQSPVSPEMIPISCEVQTISSTSESSRTIASSGLENVGMAQYTEVTKVQINRTKEMEIKEETRSQKKTERILANDDVAITRMYHYQTKATSQSYRLQMETTYQPLSTREYSTPATTVRQQEKPKRHVSSAGHVVRPVMPDNQNFYNYSNHNTMVPVSSHQPFMNPNLNGMNNMAMVGMGPISTNYGSAFSVPHFGHSPSMPYTPDEYGGYYQPAGSAVQPVLDPCLVHKPVPYHPPQHHHHHPPPPPPSQPHNHYASGDQCISRHALSSTPSCPMESIPQPHYPQEAMNPNSSSRCFTQDMPHSSPPLAYYSHDMPHSTNPPPPPPYSQENVPQSNAPRGFSQDPLPHNNHQFLQNEISNTPRPLYTQDPMAPHNLPSHGFRQDCMPTNLPRRHYSQDISNCNQAPRPYLSPPNVLSPNNLASPCYSQENSPVRPSQHLNNQPPSCPPLPQKPSSAHSNFHGSIHGPNFHCQSHTAPIQKHPHPQPQNTMYPKHQATSIPRDYSPGPTYHELTPVITSRQKDIKTRTPRETPTGSSFPPVPKAEATQRQHQSHLPMNQNISSCNKSQFPRPETNNAVVIRGQTERRLQPCNSPGAVLNGRINSISGKEPPVFQPRRPNDHSCSTTNGNNNTSSSRTLHHGNRNIPNQSLDSQKAQDLKIKRRMKKSSGLDENTNSSDSKTHSNSFQNGNGSFQQEKVSTTSKLKTKLKQPKISQNNKQKSVNIEKQSKTKMKLPNNSSKILELNGILSPLKQELPKKNGKKKYSNGWSWEGEPFEKLVLLNNDDPLRLIKCFPAMCHVEGDIIRVRDCVLLKSGPKKTDLPFVAKIVALWENPEDGEMMTSLMWYYRPEHTEQGRTSQDMEDEIFASKHRDVNSVACIEDKCYVLTFTEYCRYRKGVKMIEEEHNPETSMVPKSGEIYPRLSRLPPGRVSPEMVFFCRKVYDFRQKRLLKNPM